VPRQRRLVPLVTVLSLALLAPATSSSLASPGNGGAGVAKRKKCDTGRETNGCKLKRWSSFSGSLAGGSIFVSSAGSSFSVDVTGPRYHPPPKATCGSVRAVVKKALEVGRTSSFAGQSRVGFWRYAIRGTLKVRSATSATATGTITARYKSFPAGCTYNFNATLARSREKCRPGYRWGTVEKNGERVKKCVKKKAQVIPPDGRYRFEGMPDNFGVTISGNQTKISANLLVNQSDLRCTFGQPSGHAPADVANMSLRNDGYYGQFTGSALQPNGSKAEVSGGITGGTELKARVTVNGYQGGCAGISTLAFRLKRA
jgi:hypothetical protein